MYVFLFYTKLSYGNVLLMRERIIPFYTLT